MTQPAYNCPLCQHLCVVHGCVHVKTASRQVNVKRIALCIMVSYPPNWHQVVQGSLAHHSPIIGSL